MKKLLVLGISVVTLAAFVGVARAADIPTKQDGRVWIDQNFVLALSPQWSLSTMPGARAEFARTREGVQGLNFLELFFGPNYTYKTGNWTIKGSLWYYYMGYPQRGRTKEGGACSNAPLGPTTYCASTYNASHNIELIPSGEYRFGRWSIYDRIIFHNTFYADVYSNPTSTVSVASQRLGWGTVLRELLQLRYALNDRAGVFVSDEIFLGLIEDGDTSSMKNAAGVKTGYTPLGYWKFGFRYNRSYLGFDYKVTPNFTIAPMYMVEIGLSPTDSTDVTDVAHNLFVVATVTAKMFEGK
jgi:hypothetical protein